MIQANVLSHWHQFIENMSQSPLEFYSTIVEIVKAEEIPDIRTSHVKLSEKGPLSAKREYLRISSKGYFFDVCAAPYGKGFFVSYWHQEYRNSQKSLFRRIPWIGGFLERIFMPETFYTSDTRLMFQSSIHYCVVLAVNNILESKGLRALSETERQAQVSV